ncbi:MAG: helix-turn-helix transcriptional regulator [Bacteroidota bacterium]
MSEKKIPVYKLEQVIRTQFGVFLLDFADDIHLYHLEEISTPHRHDHYCCFLVEDGYIDFNVDFKPVKIQKYNLLISYPGQVHQVGTDQECKGRALIFDAKLVDENAKMVIEDSLTKVALLTLDEEGFDWFTKIFDLIYAAIYADHKVSLHAQLIRSLLDSFLHQAAICYQLQEHTRMQDHPSRMIDITKRFRKLVQTNYKTIKKPSVYAEQMNFSVSYLNDTVKAVTGFSLTYFIQQEVICEAQRLLYYSELSIREIAYSLGYDDDKYFIRLFGKVTGSSPSIFRKNIK